MSQRVSECVIKQVSKSIRQSVSTHPVQRKFIINKDYFHNGDCSTRTLDGQGDLLDLLGLGVDAALVGAAVVVAHFANEEVPLLDVGTLHADPVVVYRSSVHVADEDLPWVHPDHLPTQRNRGQKPRNFRGFTQITCQHSVTGAKNH